MESLAAAAGYQRTSLVENLTNEAFRFEFYQAVRLLEILYLKSKKGDKKELRKLLSGEFFTSYFGAIKFSSKIDPSFPASDVEEIKLPEKEDDPYEMVVNFLGLAGVSGPLPAFYTQLILESEKMGNQNKAFREFLDIFNHRLISLMYEIRKKHRTGFDLRKPEDTFIASLMFSVIGMGSESLRNRLGINDYSLLHFTGLLSNKNRSLAGLEFILSEYFKATIDSNYLIGQWQKIDDSLITVIGRKGKNQTLGESVILGRKIWYQESKFQLKIGPLRLDQYLDLLPLKKSHSFYTLYKMTKHYSGPEYNFDFRYLVHSGELPKARLGDKHGSYLGWTTWIPPKEGGIFDFDYLLFVETKDKIKTTLEDGQRVRLGWTVWVPDTKTHEEYIEVKISSKIVN